MNSSNVDDQATILFGMDMAGVAGNSGLGVETLGDAELFFFFFSFSAHLESTIYIKHLSIHPEVIQVFVHSINHTCPNTHLYYSRRLLM